MITRSIKFRLVYCILQHLRPIDLFIAYPVNTHTRRLIHTYTYIYIYIVLFGPVKPELGVIPSGQENYSRVNI